MDGFALHGSGLFVPEELKRQREVWSLQEFKALDKVTQWLEARGVRVFLGCADPDCNKAGPMDRIRSLDGGITYRCPHKDRVVMKLRG